jgi:hypothetical protein
LQISLFVAFSLVKNTNEDEKVKSYGLGKAKGVCEKSGSKAKSIVGLGTKPLLPEATA